MATVSQSTSGRRAAIGSAIATELERQAHEGAVRIDIEALADAIELAIAGHGDVGEGKHPDELNATNDD
jgi:hypothetical protein